MTTNAPVGPPIWTREMAKAIARGSATTPTMASATSCRRV